MEKKENNLLWSENKWWSQLLLVNVCPEKGNVLFLKGDANDGSMRS